MEATEFVRKPFEVQAIQVTTENMKEVADWCGGVVDNLIYKGVPRPYVKVPAVNALNDRHRQAFVSDWVIWAKNGETWKSYSNKSFWLHFEEAATNEELVENESAQNDDISVEMKARIKIIAELFSQQVKSELVAVGS